MKLGCRAHDAGRADEHEVLHVLRVLQGIAGRQVAAHAVPYQQHLVQAHALPPGGEGGEKKILRVFPRLGGPRRPPCVGAETSNQRPGLRA